jgi:hypothetical protein
MKEAQICHKNMKEAMIIIYTPDMCGPQALDFVERLTRTDLSRAELLVYDHAYDDKHDVDAGERIPTDAGDRTPIDAGDRIPIDAVGRTHNRASVLENLREFAGRRRVIMMDTNTVIEDPGWLDKFLNTPDEGGPRG